MAFRGYEIHMGRGGNAFPIESRGNVYGSYVHGIFDAEGVAETIIRALCRKKGVDESLIHSFDPDAYKERQYDALADAVRQGLDMDLVYKILNREA